MSVSHDRRDGGRAFSGGAMACAARNVALHHAFVCWSCAPV